MKRRLAALFTATILLTGSLTVAGNTPTATSLMVNAKVTCKTLKLNNNDLHPYVDMTCYAQTAPQAQFNFRARATCWPGINAYGPWTRPGGTSRARCFFALITSHGAQVRW